MYRAAWQCSFWFAPLPVTEIGETGSSSYAFAAFPGENWSYYGWSRLMLLWCRKKEQGDEEKKRKVIVSPHCNFWRKRKLLYLIIACEVLKLKFWTSDVSVFVVTLYLLYERNCIIWKAWNCIWERNWVSARLAGWVGVHTPLAPRLSPRWLGFRYLLFF